MVEGLGCYIKDALQNWQLRGLSFQNTPAFTHQQFVDDNMLFGHPLVQEARKLKSILSDLLDVSRNCINK